MDLVAVSFAFDTYIAQKDAIEAADNQDKIQDAEAKTSRQEANSRVGGTIGIKEWWQVNIGPNNNICILLRIIYRNRTVQLGDLVVPIH